MAKAKFETIYSCLTDLYEVLEGKGEINDFSKILGGGTENVAGQCIDKETLVTISKILDGAN